MIFKGHQTSSFIDYPNKISTVFFSGGCNFRCPYCHNSSLVKNQGEILSEDYVFNYLKKKKKYLDAVCVSGGECTLYKDELYEFLRKVKNMGYLTKIDTNGTKPYFINKLINNNMLDYIAMDIKAPLNNYNLVTQSNVDIEKIRMSINIIKSSKISSEFRTTVCKELITINDIEKISELIKGSKKYIIQNFKDGDTILAGENKFTPYTRGELNEIINKIQDKFEICKYR